MSPPSWTSRSRTRAEDTGAELTVHSLALRIPSATVEVDFKERPEGSESKLRTYRDGTRILKVIVSLARYERPVLVHGLVGLFFATVALAAGVPALVAYAQSGVVERMPSLLTAGVFLIAAMLTLLSGFSLDASRKARHELSRLTYLGHSPVRNLMNSALTDQLVQRFDDNERDAALLGQPVRSWDRHDMSRSALAEFEADVKVRVTQSGATAQPAA